MSETNYQPGSSKQAFAFLVLAYNHEEYICEHLESIKYLVLTHGKGIEIDLIVNDDYSSDATRNHIDRWLEINNQIFRKVTKIYNPTNLGTCKSLANMLEAVDTQEFKLGAGDDVYSYEDIFSLTGLLTDDVGLLSGRVLYLREGVLHSSFLSTLLESISKIIYSNKSLLFRLKHFSFNNAPNIIYPAKCLLDSRVRLHLNKFDVTEDWPIQIGIARTFPDRKFRLVDSVLMYYRRTPGSTYLVAGNRLKKDKIKIYRDLISNEDALIERIRLRSRKYCFEKENFILNIVGNLDFYCFVFSFARRWWMITRSMRRVDLRLDKHQRHLALIKARASDLSS